MCKMNSFVGIFRNIASRPAFQPLFRILLKMAHAGMNYGGGQDVHSSGEIKALEIALKKMGMGQDLILFDVGAHCGGYCGEIISSLSCFSKIYCFEPSVRSFSQLTSKFSDTGVVSCYQLALGSCCEDLILNSECDCSTTARVERVARSGNSECVRVLTVDAFMKEQNIERVDVLKIDTEGSEVFVLEGSRESIKNNKIGIIQFEFGETFLPYGNSFRTVFDILAPYYLIYRILRNGIVPITYSYDWEIYKISNFICLRR